MSDTSWYILGLFFLIFGLDKICDCISDYAYFKYGKGRCNCNEPTTEEEEDQSEEQKDE